MYLLKVYSVTHTFGNAVQLQEHTMQEHDVIA